MTLLIEWLGSPNKESGRRGFRPEAIVVHIMDGTLLGTDARFANPGSKVSAHYGVGTNGQIHHYVAESDTAWHAGRRWQP
ncbi:MAG TPA: N-acetylmuramoyl-L-alanine amidase, partial [Methylomirabilota bacterium]|nr:N-acetylmuramoyl-L-alanine amidase [Methylomirabilota bacterium]